MSFSAKPIDNEYIKGLKIAFNQEYDFQKYEPGDCILTDTHKQYAQRILDAEVRKDDVFIVAFPRSGTTWVTELVWLISNNLDFESAKKNSQDIRVPLIEMTSMFKVFHNYLQEKMPNSIDFVDNLSSPRFIKSHLPYELLPRQLDTVKPKIVYIARNPKDVCVSYYHILKLSHDLTIPFEIFCELFLNDCLPYSPIFKKMLTFWNKRNEPNVLFVKYEDVKRNMRKQLRRIADFLGKTMTDEEYDALIEFASVENMKKNPGCNMEGILSSKFDNGNRLQNIGNFFIRKGEIGDYKNYMSPEMSQRFDAWIKEQTKGSGLEFE